MVCTAQPADCLGNSFLAKHSGFFWGGIDRDAVSVDVLTKILIYEAISILLCGSVKSKRPGNYSGVNFSTDI
jgi:hypothetical protein